MRLRRLRVGELIALAGAVCVIVSLALPWYEAPGGRLSAWSTFGVAVALLMLGAAAALVLGLATVAERTTALPVAAGVWSTLFGFAATVAAIVRVLERPDGATALCAGPWLALVGAVAILAGSWLSMRDERMGLYPQPDIPARERPL